MNQVLSFPKTPPVLARAADSQVFHFRVERVRESESDDAEGMVPRT